MTTDNDYDFLWGMVIGFTSMSILAYSGVEPLYPLIGAWLSLPFMYLIDHISVSVELK